jgi:hypothetical protein
VFGSSNVKRHADSTGVSAVKYSGYVLIVVVMLVGFSGAAVTAGYPQFRILLISSALAAAMLGIVRTVWKRGGGSDLE